MDAGTVADVFVISALVRVLESPPAADVVDEDGLEVGLPGLDVLNQLLQPVPSADIEAALAFVGVRSDDADAASGGVLADFVGLVLGRVLLMLCGHADIFRRQKLRGLFCLRVLLVVLHSGRPFESHTRSERYSSIRTASWLKAGLGMTHTWLNRARGRRTLATIWA